MDAHFCTAALEEAIVKYGVPSIFNVSKAVNSLQRHFFPCCKTMVSRSVWMEKIGRSIISIKPSTNGLDKGAQLIMSEIIPRIMRIIMHKTRAINVINHHKTGLTFVHYCTILFLWNEKRLLTFKNGKKAPWRDFVTSMKGHLSKIN